jgi:hypothetical protein
VNLDGAFLDGAKWTYRTNGADEPVHRLRSRALPAVAG